MYLLGARVAEREKSPITGPLPDIFAHRLSGNVPRRMLVRAPLLLAHGSRETGGLAARDVIGRKKSSAVVAGKNADRNSFWISAFGTQ